MDRHLDAHLHVLTIIPSIHLPTPQAGAIPTYGDNVYVEIHMNRTIIILKNGK